MDTKINANVNPIAEASVVELLANVFNSIAYIDADTVRHNIELACDGGMTKNDRSIPIELAGYLLDNFSLIFVGLIANKDFRDTIAEAVSVEIALDDRDSAFTARIREEMKDGTSIISGDDFIIDFSDYNDTIYKSVNSRLADSLDMVSSFDSSIDELAAELTDDEMIDIGYCVSNFMYLIRAFAKNTVFTNYIKSVVHSVKKQLDIK